MIEKIVLENGKYTVVLDQEGCDFRFYALHYEDVRSELTGNNLALAMFYRIQALETGLEKLVNVAAINSDIEACLKGKEVMKDARALLPHG